MNVTELSVDALTHEYRIALPGDLIEEKVSTRVHELAQSMRLPGFRPGKVPVSLVRKRFLDSIRAEVVDGAIKDATDELIGQRGLRPAVAPSVRSTEPLDDGGLAYVLAVETLPEIGDVDVSGLEVERLTAEVEETEVDATLQRIATSIAERKPRDAGDAARQGDVIVFEVTAPEDAAPFVRGQQTAIEIGASALAPVGLDEQLAGLVADEEKQVTLSFPESWGDPALAGREISYTLRVASIAEVIRPEIDDGLAERIGIPSLSALTDHIRGNLKETLQQASRLRLKRQILDRLAEKVSFPVPPSLAQREYEVISRSFGAEAAAEGEHHADDACGHEGHQHGPECGHGAATSAMPGSEADPERWALAERRVRLGLLLADIGQKNNLRVTSEELNKAIGQQISRYPGREQEVLAFFRNERSARDALAAPILEDKVIDLILELAKVSDRTVDPQALLADEDDGEQ